MGLTILAYADFHTVTWTVATGTPLTDYGVANLTDLDPSNPLSISETTIVLTGDQGSALLTDVVTLHHHNFPAGTTLRLQMNSSNSWGAPPVDMTVDVGTWTDDGFAPHILFDLKTAYPVAGDRTYRYLRFTNDDVATSPISIGEMVVGALSTLTRGMQLPLTRITAWGAGYVAAKRGPRYIHDRRTRERAWSARLSVISSEWSTFRNLIAASKGLVYPMLVWPSNVRTDEPILGRWSVPSLTERNTVNTVEDVDATFEELSCGEAY